MYNISIPLALVLTIFGFLTCGRLSFTHSTTSAKSSTTQKLHALISLRWKWTLDLGDLRAKDWFTITHDASLVHVSGVPSNAPDPKLFKDVLRHAEHPLLGDDKRQGLSIHDLARIRVLREASLSHPLSTLHAQIAQGEAGFLWLVMGDQACRATGDGIIPISTLQQWLWEERLPEGWWESMRPVKTVGLFEARRRAGDVARDMGTIRSRNIIIRKDVTTTAEVALEQPVYVSCLESYQLLVAAATTPNQMSFRVTPVRGE